MSYALQAEGLVKRFGKTTALAGMDLAVPTGTILGILGPNGAGKTTAVRGHESDGGDPRRAHRHRTGS